MSARDLPDDAARAVELVDALKAQFLAPPPRIDTAEWAAQYRHISKGPERGPWRNERTPYLVEPMQCASAHQPFERVVLWFATQMGKALALDTPIATPTGWQLMGDLGVGDSVFDEFCTPCQVIGRSPVYVDHDCYRVTFSDGEAIVADAGHLWPVNDEIDPGKLKRRTLTTETLARHFMEGKRYRFAVPVFRKSESTRRRIVAVDRVPSVPVRCISVNSPSRLYLAGREMIPTHNSEVLYNSVMQRIHTDPQDMMMVQPTLQDAQDHSAQRFLPTIMQTPAMLGKVAVRKSRDESTSWRSRSIQGGFTVFFAGANSAASLASKPLGFAVADEVDKWPADVDNEGPPLGLLEERMSNFSSRKLIIASTCSIKGMSTIEREYLASDQRKYHVPCPHCGEAQVLLWGAKTDWGIKWLKDAGGAARPETAVYICRHCGAAIEEHGKKYMLHEGIWVPEAPGAGLGKRAGFWINKLYSPLGWKGWPALVEEWEATQVERIKGNSSPLKKFLNSSLAETWEETGTGADSRALAARAEPYELGVVPRGGLMLTMGVDTQPDRLEARVWAFGRGEESWLVARHIIYGDPNLDENTPGSPWTRLTEIRRTPVMHTSGAQMLIEASCVDSGGSNTSAVYSYCRGHSHANVLAIKGASTYGKPIIGKPSLIDVTWRGKTAPRSLKLWLVGTDTAKHLLYGRMRVTQVGPGYVHVPESLKTTDEFEQMTAARLMPVVVQGKASMRWTTPSGKREEGGDAMVYAYAGACYLGIQTYREPGWARREMKYAPREPDLFAPRPDLVPVSASSPTDTSASSYQNNTAAPRVSGGRISLAGTRRGES